VARAISARADEFLERRHDDQVDSTAQMRDWFKRRTGPGSDAGIYELTRQRAEEARDSPSRAGAVIGDGAEIGPPPAVVIKALGHARPVEKYRALMPATSYVPTGSGPVGLYQPAGDSSRLAFGRS
jgi:hypothetical protein